ncbi:hypothetical protein BUE80_DR004051 [Diplocarpon rosae]|nr:hypothetical protein BUE80_DR004051 [Diplocarpon rosae]
MRYTVASVLSLAVAMTSASIIDRSVDCEAQANTCRTQPEANQATCSAEYAACLGYNPYANNQTATTTAVATTPSSSSSAESCEAVANKCRVQPEANQATCSAEYAACLGYNPYASPAASSPVYTTEVVTKYTTYCPEPTTFVGPNSKTYTVTQATTLTIEDCPCTVTSQMAPAATGAAGGNGTVTSSSGEAPKGSSSDSSYKPATNGSSSSGETGYTGAAGSIQSPAYTLLALVFGVALL